MADTPDSAGSESPAQRQARIRKEKREAKIKNGGSARLNKIIGLGGGLPRDEAPAPSPKLADDPEEVDISNHYYEPQSRKPLPRAQSNGSTPSASQQQQMSDDQLRQMMLGMDPSMSSTGPNQNPFAGFPGMTPPGGSGGDGSNDSMMQFLQQMMGGAAGEGKDGMPSFPGMPGMPGMDMQDQAEAAAVDPFAYIWRIIHAIFALSLGLYIAFTTSFTGTKLERVSPNALNTNSIQFFYIFASAEVVLLTSRFYLEKKNAAQGGWMGTIMGFLPEPYKGYVGLVLRYARIWGTVSGDAMVCVFVLGVCAWLRGGE